METSPGTTGGPTASLVAFELVALDRGLHRDKGDCQPRWKPPSGEARPALPTPRGNAGRLRSADESGGHPPRPPCGSRPVGLNEHAAPAAWQASGFRSLWVNVRLTRIRFRAQAVTVRVARTHVAWGCGDAGPLRARGRTRQRLWGTPFHLWRRVLRRVRRSLAAPWRPPAGPGPQPSGARPRAPPAARRAAQRGSPGECSQGDCQPRLTACQRPAPACPATSSPDGRISRVPG